jgi:hypothetical protein
VVAIVRESPLIVTLDPIVTVAFVPWNASTIENTSRKIVRGVSEKVFSA